MTKESDGGGRWAKRETRKEGWQVFRESFRSFVQGGGGDERAFLRSTGRTRVKGDWRPSL